MPQSLLTDLLKLKCNRGLKVKLLCNTYQLPSRKPERKHKKKKKRKEKEGEKAGKQRATSAASQAP